MMQIINKDILKILTIFSVSPGSKFLRNELKEKTNMNNVVLDNSLTILINSSLILKKGKFLFLNFENENTNKIAEFVNLEYKKLKRVPFNAYFSVLEIVNYLSKFKGLSVYLFGSYSKLVFNEKSDIDIAIISDSLKNKRDIGRITRKIEKIYGKEISIQYFSNNFYKNKSDPIVKEILRNGVKLI